MNRVELIERLSLHAQAASERLHESMQPLPGRSIGFVEAVAIDDSGLTWVIGWIRDDGLFDRPIVILDNGRHVAGFAYTLVDRDDLPPDAKGFVGVLHTEWRASADLPPHFFLADGSGRYLEPVIPTPIRTTQTIAPAVNDLLARAAGGCRDLLRDLSQSALSWPVPDAGASVDRVYVDQAAILPGFGALITGWALSPSKESRHFTLKADDRTIPADERSVARFPRADLSHLHGQIDLALARAGFTAVFQGDLNGIRLDDMVLKGSWTDGSVTNTDIPPDRIRLLGVTAPIESALTFCPALEAESFFPDFARHAAAAVRERAAMFTIYEAAPVAAAIVLVTPATTADLFLLFDGAVSHAANLPPDWGIVIVGCPDGVRPLLVSLFADLKRVTGRACSLLLTPTAAATNDVLTGVIDALGLDRFAFVAAIASLTPGGWAALGAPVAGLTLLEINDLAATGSVAGIAGLDAFACDAATWRRIAAAAPPRIGGVVLDTATAVGACPQRVVADAAFALALRRASGLVARINESLAPHD